MQTDKKSTTFDEWMEKVDQAVQAIAGVSVPDLADFAFWDAWNDEESPRSVARRLLEEEGF